MRDEISQKRDGVRLETFHFAPILQAFLKKAGDSDARGFETIPNPTFDAGFLIFELSSSANSSGAADLSHISRTL